jgi:hypothetical protein
MAIPAAARPGRAPFQSPERGLLQRRAGNRIGGGILGGGRPLRLFGLAHRLVQLTTKLPSKNLVVLIAFAPKSGL